MIENSIVYRNFKGKYEYFPLLKALGSEIWDREGKRYIDFTSGWNVTNLGWNNPEITEAVIAQANKNVQGLLWGSDPIQEEYAAAITDALPDGLDACVKENGGTESIEVSLKIARCFTNRKKIVGFENLYHGQLFASLALGNKIGKLDKLSPLVPDIISIPFPHEDVGEEGFNNFIKEFELLLSKEDVAAVLTEPEIVTGWGSTLLAYPGFLTKIREITKKYGTLLIVDEVGTGFSRTGKLFGIEHENVVPDMIVFAKGIANGAGPIGTVVGNSKIFEPAFNDAWLISTFGWSPVVCAAALKTLQIHQRDKVWQMAEQKGEYLTQKLTPFIGNKLLSIRGKGLEIGLRCKDFETAQEIQQSTFADGLHIVVGGGNNIQLMPPLTTSQEIFDEGLDILIKHLK